MSGAAAAEGWLPSRGLSPLEERVAVAVGSGRSTLWTSLRFDAPAGAVGIVLPVPEGASLDLSSDAWLEALEVASAPRVLSPSGLASTCPGQPDVVDAFEMSGNEAHVQALAPVELLVLDDVATVQAWAGVWGLAVPDLLAQDLAQLGGVRFLVARFDAVGGPAITPTLRVVMPGAPPMLPLTLTRAGSEPLDVTTWVLGAGRASLTGATEVLVTEDQLAWRAAEGRSNYRDLRAELLDTAGSDAVVVESASHEALAKNQAIADGKATIDGVITTYFLRGAGYGDALDNPALCIAQSAAILGSIATVAAACPRAGLGVVGGAGPGCVEAPAGGQADPAKLRCGGVADDLALALSTLPGQDVFLTRQVLRIGPDGAGASFPVAMLGAQTISPVLNAGKVDVSGCGADAGPDASTGTSSGGSTGSGGPGTGAGTGSGQGSVGSGEPEYVDSTNVYTDITCDCSGTGDTAGTDVSSDSSGDSCGGSSDTTDQSGDACDGDSSDGASDGGDSCSGTSDSSTDTCSGSGSSGDSGDSCSGGSSSGGDSGCSGGGSSGGDTCSGGSGGSSDCAVGRGGHGARLPRLSAMAFLLMAVLAPLRRMGRRKRKAKRPAR